MESPREGNDGSAENPFQPPQASPDQPARANALGRLPMPGTVIAVIVLVSLLGVVSLVSTIQNPLGSPIGLAITAVVLVGMAKGRAWARTIALTLSFIVLGVTAFATFFGLVLLLMGRSEVLSLVVPLLLSALSLHVPMVILLYTRSARLYFSP